MKTSEDIMIKRFANKKVLLFVPHEDDEISTAGTLLIQFISHNVKCKVVFSTNGEKYTAPARRIKEATNSLSRVGIKKEDIIFLGFPDVGIDDEAEGRKKTFTVIEGPELIKKIITGFRPDFIIANDKDPHPNHVELSCLVDNAMADIIKTTPDYRPLYFKTFAYDLAYEAIADYRAYNLGATVRPEVINNPEFNWDLRLRLPVPASTRTRLISTNDVFKMFWKHHSQGAFRHSLQTANSDKVYWLLYADNTDSTPWFIKICHDENYVYDYHTDIQNPVFSVLAFDMCGHPMTLSDSSVIWFTDGIETATGRSISPDISGHRKIRIGARLSGYPDIEDEITVCLNTHINRSERVFKALDRILQRLYLWADWLVNEIYRVKVLVHLAD